MGTRVLQPVEDFENTVLNNLAGLFNYVKALPACSLQPREVLSKSKENNIYHSFALTRLQPDPECVIPILTLVQMFRIYSFTFAARSA